VLFVLSAGLLAPDALASLKNTAERDGFRLLLFFERLADPTGLQLLGAGGHAQVVFFSLSSATRRRTEGCRVSGVGVQVRGQWLHHHSRLEHRVVDEHDRRVRPEHEPRRELRAGPRLVRYEGNEQVQTARHERGWRDRTSTQYSSSQGRVHEFVLEPDEFKRIPEGAALVINGDEVTLTFCDPKIRRLPVTVPFP
jgi:hypothetical protein